MLKEIKDNSPIENCFKYFPYFNHKLYDNPSDIPEEEYSNKSDSESINLEDSSTNISHDSIYSIDNEEKFIPLNLLDLSPNKTSSKSQMTQYPTPVKLFNSDEQKDKNENKAPKKEIQPDLQKFKLPKSLFCTNKNYKNDSEKKKFQQISSTLIMDSKLDLSSQPYVPKYKAFPFVICYKSVYFGYNERNKFGQMHLNYSNYYQNQNNNLEKKKKKKKNEFVEREGDWSCYRCKNINFSFRDKCNKCQLSKDESEKQFKQLGEALLKLADISIYENKNKNDLK